MSSGHWRNRIQQEERKLKQLRAKRASEAKKVQGKKADVARLTKHRASARSEGQQASYQRQIDSKERELASAESALVKVEEDIGKSETALADAKSKLGEAEAQERKREEQKEATERRQQEGRRRLEEQRALREERQRAREETSREAARAAREVDQEQRIDRLHDRATDLERKLAEASRRAAPPEISVLFLAASPEDQPPLRLDRESREIQKKVRAADFRDSIFFETRLARQLTDLIQDLNETKPDVLHFSGHGDQASLVFEDETGATTELGNEQLGRLLDAAGRGVRLVVFNSCESEAQAQMAIEHVDIAIGMNTSIGDDVAKTFAGQFYNSLGFGMSVSETFRQAVLQIELEHGHSHEIPQLVSKDGIDPETVVLVNPDA